MIYIFIVINIFGRAAEEGIMNSTRNPFAKVPKITNIDEARKEREKEGTIQKPWPSAKKTSPRSVNRNDGSSWHKEFAGNLERLG